MKMDKKLRTAYNIFSKMFWLAMFVCNLQLVDGGLIEKSLKQLQKNQRAQKVTTLYKTIDSDVSKPSFGGVTDLNDVYISVKTSGKFHRTRLQIVIDTWFNNARKQTFFFTDKFDIEYNIKTGGHLINTGCKDGHSRNDLSCKLGVEYDSYIKSGKKWWCHFDDDNYVNVYELLSLLQRYDWNDDVYVGRPSLDHPFDIGYENKDEEFWFATGGAGLCVSKSLAIKMKPWCSDGKLIKTSEALKAPDDCTLGFVIYNRLGVNLTSSTLLHSHLETLSDIYPNSLDKQVTLSYKIGNKYNNVVNTYGLTPYFTKLEDPTRLYSVHCLVDKLAPHCLKKNG